MRRRFVALWRALLVVVLALLIVLFGVSSASAHAQLESTQPGQDSELASAPSAVTLVFGEDVGINAGSLRVSDSRGARVDVGLLGHVGNGGRTVQVMLKPGLGRGSYTVVWRVVSADGHPVAGTFAFGVGVPAGAVAQAATVDATVQAVRLTATWVGYLATALLLGASVFMFWLWPQGRGDGSRLRALTVLGIVLGLASTVVVVLVQGPYIAGSSVSSLFDRGLLQQTLASSYGRPLLLRLLAFGLSVPTLGIWPPVRDDDIGPGVVAAGGNLFLLVFSYALTGHAATAAPRLLSETADAVHVAAAGVWVGGLLILLVAFLPAADRTGSERTLALWSRTAMGCVAVLVVSGVYQSWREVGEPAALPATSYGRLLLTKLALVGVTLLLATVARRLVQHATTGTGIRRVVAAETALTAGVLAVTSVLVSTAPARTTFAPPFAATVIARNTDGDTLRVRLEVTSTGIGPETVHLTVTSPTGDPLTFSSATAELVPFQGDLGPVRLTFDQTDPGQATAATVLPSVGRWRMTVQVLLDEDLDYAASIEYTVR